MQFFTSDLQKGLEGLYESDDMTMFLLPSEVLEKGYINAHSHNRCMFFLVHVGGGVFDTLAQI